MEDTRSLKISQLISKQLSDHFIVEHDQYCRTQPIQDTAFVQKKKKSLEKIIWPMWQNICDVSNRWVDKSYLNPCL